MSCRRGMSLIEMMIALMVSSVIAGIAVTLVGSLLRTEGVGRRHLAETRALDRLARKFALDVHAAIAVERSVAATDVKTVPPLAVFSTDTGSQIEYRQQERQLLCLDTREGQLVRQESFRLPDGYTVRVATEPESSPRWVTLILDRADSLPSPGLQSARHGWNVVAELGRDRRLAQTAPLAVPKGVEP